MTGKKILNFPHCALKVLVYYVVHTNCDIITSRIFRGGASHTRSKFIFVKTIVSHYTSIAMKFLSTWSRGWFLGWFCGWFGGFGGWFCGFSRWFCGCRSWFCWFWCSRWNGVITQIRFTNAKNVRNVIYRDFFAFTVLNAPFFNFHAISQDSIIISVIRII